VKQESLNSNVAWASAVLAAVLISVYPPFAQQPHSGAAPINSPRAKKDQAEVVSEKLLPQFEITLEEDTSYPSLDWPERWMQGNSVESYCIGDGNVYVLRPALGLVGLTPKGIVPFLRDKMTDIPHAETTWGGLSPSISASGISFGAMGIDDEKVDTKTWTDAEGHTHAEKDVTNAVLPYIVKFDNDGTYKGAIKLDLPFNLYSFAAFSSGNLVGHGADQNKIPRIALLDASAKFLRYMDLRKDISTSRSVSADDIKCNGCTADVGSVIFNGYFTPADGNILFKREFSGVARIYEIHESGEARVVDIKSPHNYEIGALIASDRNWFLEFKKPNAKGIQPDGFDSLLEVNPQNGEPLREYRLKPPYRSPETVVSALEEGSSGAFTAMLRKKNLLSFTVQASFTAGIISDQFTWYN
jgi:hypothetical protein